MESHQGLRLRRADLNDPLAPLLTVTCANRGELTLISPLMLGRAAQSIPVSR